MRIKDMEWQIDRQGFEKLEVRLRKGSEVSCFICCITTGKDVDDNGYNENIGFLIVFNEKGQCYETISGAKWYEGEANNLEFSKDELGEYVPTIINGYKLYRNCASDLIPD